MTELDIRDYKAVYFLDSIGVDLSLPTHQVKEVINNKISTYQLKCFHHDIQKRPVAMFDEEGTKWDLYQTLLNDKTKIDNLKCEIVSDREYQRRMKESRFNKKIIPLMVMALIMAVVIVVSVLDMYIKVKGGM